MFTNRLMLQFVWTPYDDPALQAMCPPWFLDEAEWGTWLSVVPLVCFNIVEFHHADRVKRQFNGEQPPPEPPVNVDRFLTTTGRGDDVWWPEKHSEWYDLWRARFAPGHRIVITACHDYRPTVEYWDWYRAACRVRHLSGQHVLDDPRLFELPADVQPTASQPRDILQLPRDVPDRRRRAVAVREDTRRPARRERGARERRGAADHPGDRVRARRARLDAESDEEDHGDDPPPSPPPPPPAPHHPPSGSGSQPFMEPWDTSPPGWHDPGPSSSHQVDDTVEEWSYQDVYQLHTTDQASMQRIADQFRTGREQSIGQPSHASAPASTSVWAPTITPGASTSYGSGVRPGAQYATPPSIDYGRLVTASQPQQTPPVAPLPPLPPQPQQAPRPSRPRRQTQPPHCGTGHRLHSQDDQHR